MERTNYNNHVAQVKVLKPHSGRNGKSSVLRIALVTNHPPPFRIPIYERIARMPGVELHAIFCSEREPNRQWSLPPLHFNHVFLKERFVERGSNYIHNNPDVLAALNRIAPDVIVTTGFNPTFLYAFGYSVIRNVPHVPMTDGTNISEAALSRWHRAVRRIVYSRSRAFIAASLGGLRLYADYGIPRESGFLSCLCIDNDAYAAYAGTQEKQYDLIFCGRIVADKNPLFALQLADGLATRLGRRTSILFVGSGEQEAELNAMADKLALRVDVTINGHAEQHELPALYGSARLFLFPTARDVWGVVANEACAAGLPVIVTPDAGVAGELVLDGENGFVCGLDLGQWIDRAELLLTNDALYRRFAARSLDLVAGYSFNHAADGIVQACLHATGRRHDDDDDACQSHGRKVG
ncbi:glycosyltransferase [Noviherbaspirillum sp. CPCC 100848]|uniref:Glycosyltransferase n=1 Tax=Noviherbaspirillum album TaxID=3080276 RepID=A0ABU6JE69_9BURK|nr:glycosyltransferase [Noviherbaspirillum sp. CPCC 100848]MEC4721961.1 glycosyltransferase [Noviherbaspirillum sp. CPCC 100848]